MEPQNDNLNPVIGTYHDGQVELDAPVDWPDGARVSVIPREEPLGLPESEWPNDPAALAALLARIDAIEPLELTPEDEAEIAAARAAVRDESVRAVRRMMGL